MITRNEMHEALDRLEAETKPCHLVMSLIDLFAICAQLGIAFRVPDNKGATRDQVEAIVIGLMEPFFVKEPVLRRMWDDFQLPSGRGEEGRSE